MKSQLFKVKLLEEVVISERAANEGGHSSLDYLPGATFLGAMANRLYEKLYEQEPDLAYQVFDSGKVRFGNALPLSEEGQLTYPMPLCWYKRKDDSRRGNMTLCNYQHDELDNDSQPEQLRGNYVSLAAKEPKHRITEISPRFRMKTAIDPKTGTAIDGQLFGYSSLPTDLEFVWALEADDDIEQFELIVKQFELIVKKLLGEPIKIGRSRSAEYGAVEITLADKALEAQADERKPPAAAVSEVTFWLLADAALQDEHGQPLLHPTAKSVGLPENFQLDLEKTFVRSRRYAPFNAKRRRRELERVVLTMGSVLHFYSDQEVDATTLEQIHDHGIGLYRQAGLGRVWINPPLLERGTPQFKTPKKDNTTNKKAHKVLEEKVQNDPVYRYLNRRREQPSDISTVEKAAKEWITALKTLYESAEKLSYVPPGVCPGPTATQWGRVMDIAKNASDVPSLMQRLFQGEEAVCKENDPQWSKRFYIEGQTENDDFRLWLQNKIRTETKQSSILKIVARFARLARDVADQKTHS